jgi:hypothetical protein
VTYFEYYATLAVVTYGIRVASFEPGPASIGMSVFDWFHECPERFEVSR